MSEPTLGGAQAPASAPVPPPRAPRPPAPTPEPAAAPAQAAKVEKPKPQEPAEEKVPAIAAVVDRAAVALAVGGVEEQLVEWWPLLEQNILNTVGEKGASVTFKVVVEPDPATGLKAHVSSKFSGSSLRRTWSARIREDKEGDKQLELFTA